ncbi:hypothetical protein LCGC14_1887900, partial [marine sediment metagenome]
LAMSSDGKYIVTIGGIGKDIYLFNRSSSTPLWIYSANNWIYSLAISSDGNYIIAGGDTEAAENVYFFNTSNSLDPLLWSYKAIGDILGLSISSNNSQIAVVTEYWDIYFFNKSSSTPMQIWSASGDVNTIRFSSNGEYIVAGGRDNNVYLYHWSNPTPVWNYTTEGRVNSVAISSDENYIVAGGESVVLGDIIGKVYFFEKSSSTPLWNYTFKGSVHSVVFSSDGKYFVVGSLGENWNRKIYLFQSLYSQPLAKYSFSDSYGISTSISSDGNYIAVSSDNNIYLFHKSGFDDEYEENDNFFEAPVLSEGNYASLTLNGINKDYFGINVSSNMKIEIEILFDHSFGNLDLYLYDPSQIEINSSSSNTDDEHVSYLSNSSGLFTILVDSASNSSIQPYELRIRLSVIQYRQDVLPNTIISITIISIIIALGIVGSFGLIYGIHKYHWLWNRKMKKEINLEGNELKSRKIELTLATRKTLYAIPIFVFFVAWCVNVGIGIGYITLYRDLNLIDWGLDWVKLTDYYLIYTNTLSSLFFGCYAYSIIAYHLGINNFKRGAKSIYLCFPFWFGISIFLGIIGPSSYYNGWLSVHILFGLWVAFGVIISLPMVFDSPTFDSYRKETIIPRSKSIKFRDSIERNQAFFYSLIALITGTFLSINIIITAKSFTVLAFFSIFWTLFTIFLILLLNFLFSIKNDYHVRIKQKEDELLLNEFQVLLSRSKDLAERGNKNYSKKAYQLALENWVKSINYYEEALKKTDQKEKIKENLIILKESMFNTYKGMANGHNKNALKAYEKSDLQISQKEWRLAISNFEAAVDLNKGEKLHF